MNSKKPGVIKKRFNFICIKKDDFSTTTLTTTTKNKLNKIKDRDRDGIKRYSNLY